MTACCICGAEFIVHPRETLLSDAVSPQFAGKTFHFPTPLRCPKCRDRERLSFRNEWSLYKRTCSHSGKSIIAIYPAESPLLVYEQDVWWSDTFDPLSYGKPFDFTRPFFDQFLDLSFTIPRCAIQNAKSENCSYTNYSAENKNCYLLVGGFRAEDTLFSYRIAYSRDIVDCYDLANCEICYQCLQSTGLYNCRFCQHCHNSSDLLHCKDCIGCNNCIGCIDLQNASYHIFNKPFTKDKYHLEAAKLAQNSSDIQITFEKLCAEYGARKTHIIQCEDCSGDYLVKCRNCTDCFAIKDSRDCFYCKYGETNVDCGDCSFFDNCTLQYDSLNLEQNYRVSKSYLVWYCNDVYYSANCFNSKNSFGCMGLKRHNYCLLNKAYSQAEYVKLIPRVINHMNETGEWGAFFPPRLSPFAYNETTASDYYPLNAKDAANLGYRYTTAEDPIMHRPDGTEECIECHRPWRITIQEGDFYERHSIKPPTTCFRCRQRSLADKARNPAC